MLSLSFENGLFKIDELYCHTSKFFSTKKFHHLEEALMIRFSLFKLKIVIILNVYIQ
jgi:hypothetical protein